MAYEKQIWKDRQVQYPNRYVDQNGNVLQLERSPGTVTENGSLFNAEKMNHIEEGIGVAHELCQTIQDDIVTKTTNIENNSTKIENLKGTKLWTNPSPSSPISSETNITLNSADYDVIEIYYLHSTTNDNTIYSKKVIKGYGTRIELLSTDGIYYRILTYVNDTTYKLGTIVSNSTTQTEDVRSTFVIPICIVGYKTGLFDEVIE